jgi:hypothetical protein
MDGWMDGWMDDVGAAKPASQSRGKQDDGGPKQSGMLEERWRKMEKEGWGFSGPKGQLLYYYV